jgi:hypothetical protein
MKAKTKPKLTMAALAKVVGISRWTLQRLGLRAAHFRRVKLKSAKLSRGVAIKVVQALSADRGWKPLRHSVNLKTASRENGARTRTLDRILNTPEAKRGTSPVAAAPQRHSPHLLTGLAVSSTREPNGHRNRLGPSPSLRDRQPCQRRESTFAKDSKVSENRIRLPLTEPFTTMEAVEPWMVAAFERCWLRGAEIIGHDG